MREAVAGEVLTFTPYWREAAAEAGLASPGSAEELIGLPPRPLSALGPPDALVLRPSAEAVRKVGPKPLRKRLRRARLGRGREGAMRRILDPLYKPVHWLIDGNVPVGCTEADLVRLAELGRRSLELAGVTGDDAIVGLIPPGPTLSSWQLALGAREAGVPLAGLAPAASIAAVSLLGPTVLAGRPAELLRVLKGLSGSARSAVVTVLAITRAPMLGSERAELERAAGGQATVVESWAPPGVRALWAQCRGGEGVHTWPQAELVEVCAPDGTPSLPGEVGELVWTGLGWRGTTFVRLATGVHGRVVEGPCEACGRTTPRIQGARLPAGRGRRAQASAEVEGAEVEGAEVEAAEVEAAGPAPSTGRRDPVRAARARRTPRPEPVRRPEPTVAEPSVGRPHEIVLRASEDEGIVLRAVSNGGGDAVATNDEEATPWAASLPDDEADGVVRAVAKDPADSAGARPERPLGAADRLEPVDLDHLPPVPEVGPDAADSSLDDAWLPETGEIDAWPAPVLASIEGLAAWQVEHRRRKGHDELVVHLALDGDAEMAEVLVALERSVGATQYVVSSQDEVAARIAAAEGKRIVDRRSPTNGHGGARRATASPPGMDRRI